MSVIHGVCLCKFACSLKLIGDCKINTRHAFAVLYRYMQSGDKFESPFLGALCLCLLVPTCTPLPHVPTGPAAYPPVSLPWHTQLGPSVTHLSLSHSPPAPQMPTRLQVLKVGNVIVGRLLHQPLQLPVRQVLHVVIQAASLLLC